METCPKGQVVSAPLRGFVLLPFCLSAFSAPLLLPAPSSPSLKKKFLKVERSASGSRRKTAGFKKDRKAFRPGAVAGKKQEGLRRGKKTVDGVKQEEEKV